MNDLVASIRERYLQALDLIAHSARASGRSPQAVRLVVVTKTQPLHTVLAAIQAGAAILGENYPEEGVQKMRALPESSTVEWHMIGHVQSRKAQLIPSSYAMLHSLDSLKLAIRLDRFSREAGVKLPVLLEFNVGDEQTKSGWLARDESRWGILLQEMDALLALPNLQVRGLMTMPPLGALAEDSRPYFQRLRRLRDYLASQFPRADFSQLSMGTSADYQVAVQEGASLVRIGSAIIGARHYKTENT